MRKGIDVGFNYAGGLEGAKTRKDEPDYDDVIYIEVPSYHEKKRDVITLTVDEAEVVGRHLIHMVEELRK